MTAQSSAESALSMVELVEYEPRLFPREAIDDETGLEIYRRWSKEIEIDFPTVKTGHQWQLRSIGRVGWIPVSPSFSIRIVPKVEITNLFRMFEYAYELESLRFYHGLVGCNTLEDVYSRLAHLLAERTMLRARRGYYREYVQRDERLGFVRGRMHLESRIRRPWSTDIHCRYQEQTPDVEENQILGWTLRTIGRSGFCQPNVRKTVAHAFRSLQQITSPVPFTGAECAGRLYNRLNDDYETLHALCRFFLETCGPAHDLGERASVPFLVDMARLYELFLAKWIDGHLPRPWRVVIQDHLKIGQQGELNFYVDIVIRNDATGRNAAVIDAKYKRVESPATADVSQVAFYANLKHCDEAILVYPVAPARPFFDTVRGVSIQCGTFSLQGDLETNGRQFLEWLMRIIERSEARTA